MECRLSRWNITKNEESPPGVMAGGIFFARYFVADLSLLNVAVRLIAVVAGMSEA